MLEFLRFCMVGAITFLVDYGLLYFFTESFSFNYLISSAISFSVAVVVNYYLCVVFVFSVDSNQSVSRKVLFIGSSVIGLGINQICMYLIVEKLLVNYLIAKIIATIVVTIWNYVTKRKALV